MTATPDGPHDPWRPAFHFTPPRGWMNDPNGLILWRGRHQLFYQHNPYSPAPDRPMHWGHADSTDLLRWRHLPIALAPSEPYDAGMGCWSGSAVEDAGRLRLVYTGARKIEEQVVCLASGDDGTSFSKDPANPVIAGPPEGFSRDFRDPRVFRWGARWRVVIGASRNGCGCVLLYESEDLRSWFYLGVLAANDGSRGTMWECPDLFPLGDRWVLVVSPLGMPGVGSLAMIGRLADDGKRLEVEEDQILDFGHDFYAPQTMEGTGGRRIMIAWMDRWNSPEPPTVAGGWRGAMTLPREIRPGPGGKGLAIRPVEELAAWRVPLPLQAPGEIEAETADVVVELDSDPALGGELEIVFRGSRDGAEGTRVTYAAGLDEVEVDPTKSGTAARGPRRMAGRRAGGRVLLRAVLDRCSLEVFAGDPPTGSLSTLIFPRPGDLRIAVRTQGKGIRVRRLEAFRLTEPPGGR